MKAPIHAANEVDKGEGTTKVIAAIAGLAIILIIVGAAYFSGFWAPPASSLPHARPAAVQTQSQPVGTP